MSLKLDTLAYTNQLRQIPPTHKIIFAFTTLLLALFTHPLVQILLSLWMGIWTVVYAKIPLKIYLRLLIFASFFWLTSLPALIINMVNFANFSQIQKDLIYGLKFGTVYIYISHSGSVQALAIFCRAFAAISCLYFLMLTVPFTELLQTLRYLKFPAILTDLLLLMYRFIFILLKTANELWTAQNSRCGYRTWKIGMRSLAILIGQLLQRTLQQYHRFSLGLAARGMTEEFRVWHPQRYKLSKRYIIEAICGCLVLIVIELGWNAGIFTRI
ncbi:MAG: cobalt transporter component CbiQ [Cyanobacteriota bacterium]|jgi:cobalt/nickel transport system permease protein